MYFDPKEVGSRIKCNKETEKAKRNHSGAISRKAECNSQSVVQSRSRFKHRFCWFDSGNFLSFGRVTGLSNSGKRTAKRLHKGKSESTDCLFDCLAEGIVKPWIRFRVNLRLHVVLWRCYRRYNLSAIEVALGCVVPWKLHTHSSGTFLLPVPKASATSEIRHEIRLYQKGFTLILLYSDRCTSEKYLL